MDDEQRDFLTGLIIGVVCTIIICIGVSQVVESCKVRDGYLTYESKTYTVTLYDTLDRPEREE